MNSIRLKRLAAVIQEELSVFIPTHVKDPRVPSLTITSVDITQDARQATVFVAILSTIDSEDSEKRDAVMKECIEGLTSASGIMRKHIAAALDIRYIPQLLFKADKGLENTLRVHELLRQINGNKS